MAEFVDASLQMLFSERAGIVVVNLRGKKKDLVSSKAGDFRASNLMRLLSVTWSKGGQAFKKAPLHGNLTHGSTTT